MEEQETVAGKNEDINGTEEDNERDLKISEL